MLHDTEYIDWSWNVILRSGGPALVKLNELRNANMLNSEEHYIKIKRMLGSIDGELRLLGKTILDHLYMKYYETQYREEQSSQGEETENKGHSGSMG